MDGDLQDPPEVIPQLLEQYWNGFDVVYAQRVARKENWLLRACYYLFYRGLLLFSNIRMPLDAGDFGLISRRVLDELRALPEHHRYLRGLRTWVGFRQTAVVVERAERLAGNRSTAARNCSGSRWTDFLHFQSCRCEPQRRSAC